MEFKDFVAAQKELSSNKVLFITKISKDNEEKFVLIERGEILSKVLKREEIKENIKENQNKKSELENKKEKNKNLKINDDKEMER